MNFYRLAEYPNFAERQQLGVSDNEGRLAVRAIATGEKRPPRKGEWYLSGAEVEAYRAPNDLTTPFQIARLVRTMT